MILAALAGLYERTVGTEGGPPPLGYAEAPVVGALNIGPAGELNGLLDRTLPAFEYKRLISFAGAVSVCLRDGGEA
jgi:hypothetical protein